WPLLFSGLCAGFVFGWLILLSESRAMFPVSVFKKLRLVFFPLLFPTPAFFDPAFFSSAF
ncbi:MAG: hypothetical protein SPL54_03080, partial [Lachnospiraceae bacterium]|nr:hypothetical protein [Lachnospiraceae bacterium]